MARKYANMYPQLAFKFMEDLMPNDVSAAEVEKFKIERKGERDFLEKLSPLVKELEAKVSPNNSILRSMQRFLKANV